MIISKVLAQESPKTLKARQKLLRHMEEADRKITPKALKQTVIEIHQWIARHAPDRVVLRNKSIHLFDRNEHAAELSQKMAQIAENLKQKMSGFSNETTSRFYEKHKSERNA